MTIKQFTTVHHIQWGKGHIVSIQYRKQNNLIMCYFPKENKHDFVTERELRSGVGEVTLTKVARRSKDSEMSLEDAISSLFSGMGDQ